MDKTAVDRLVAVLENRIGSAVPGKRPELKLVRMPDLAQRAAEEWQWHDANLRAFEVGDIDQSPRARAIREINRISTQYGWSVAVARAVDRAGAAGLYAMSDEQVEELLARMRHLVDCAQTGCDSDEDLPAR